ncbi:MAG: ABC transporter permease [Chitinophagaceae bacterium]
MLKNYLKTAWRNLWKNKFYSVINISGLAIGLAVGIMILMWVQHESGYDGFYKNTSSLYKINSHIGSGTNAQVWEGSPAPLAVFCKQSIPEVENAVRVKDRYEQISFKEGEQEFIEEHSAFVDPAFFNVFEREFVEGNSNIPFKDDHSIVITASTAKKYFGTEKALGKILVADKENFSVSGVIQDFQENSKFHYNVLFPLSLFAKNFGGNGAWKTVDEDLGNYQFEIYLQLQKTASPETVAKKISKIFAEKKQVDTKDNFFTLQSLKTLHLVTADGNTSALRMVQVFLAVAILILLIACINYVNLSTARSMLRAKEVSMRKITGASKLQLFVQFIVESAVLFLLSAILALGVIYLLLPLYNSISGKSLVLDLKNSGVWMVIGCSILGTLLLSGIYPALLLSSFKPLLALKGKLSFGIGASGFRKVLVVTQFIFSIVLIIGTIAINKQLQYIKEKDLGYNKEHVFSFNLTKDLHDHYDAVRNELMKDPSITGIASSDGSVIGINGTTGDTYWDGKPADASLFINVNGIDQNFIPLLKMKMAAGANFSGVPADSAHFILNEAAIKQAGIKDPIGKMFTLWQTKGTIIGVVKDFNYTSVKQTIAPSIFMYDPPNWRMYVKTTGAQASKAIAAVENIWSKYPAKTPLAYTFLEEDYNKLYQSEEKTATLFNVFAVVAIVISCLGLLGLITFVAYLRTKEIGIRKVLGASTANITALMTKDFILLVLIAFIIAAPISWFAINKWLQDYSYRIHPDWKMFAAAGFMAIAIAIITVSFQAIKAALANPVKSLRTE